MLSRYPATKTLPFPVVWPPNNDWQLRTWMPSSVTHTVLSTIEVSLVRGLNNCLLRLYPGKYCFETFSGRLMTVAGIGVLGIFDEVSSPLQMVSYCISNVIHALSHLVGTSHGEARSIVTKTTGIRRVKEIIVFIFLQTTIKADIAVTSPSCVCVCDGHKFSFITMRASIGNWFDYPFSETPSSGPQWPLTSIAMFIGVGVKC